MSDKAWKKRERQIARYFGTKRVPLSGSHSGHETSSDTLHDQLYVEVKSRVKHAVVTLWDDTKQKAIKEGKLPVVALAEKNRPGFWIMMHADDLEEIYECIHSQREREHTCMAEHQPA